MRKYQNYNCLNCHKAFKTIPIKSISFDCNYKFFYHIRDSCMLLKIFNLFLQNEVHSVGSYHGMCVNRNFRWIYNLLFILSYVLIFHICSELRNSFIFRVKEFLAISFFIPKVMKVFFLEFKKKHRWIRLVHYVRISFAETANWSKAFIEEKKGKYNFL